MNELSVADIKAITTGDSTGMMGGSSFYWVIILFFLFFGRGFGFGQGSESVATSADLQRSFDTNSIINKLNGLESGLCDGFFALNNSVKDNGYATMTAIGNVGNNVINAITASSFENQKGQYDLSRQLSECC